MEKLLEGYRTGKVYSLARLITLLENDRLTMADIRDSIPKRKKGALRVGITGSGGVGKSSLVDRLITVIRNRNKTVAIVAVDPSSNFTGGALLGDRIRMQRHGEDEGVFIRSIASRGNYGGLSKSINDVVDLLDDFGVDVILIETTGVGQTEVNIYDVADMVVLVMAAGFGDEIQLMKAGQLEIADIIVINKADRDGAEDLATSIQDMFMLRSNVTAPPILLTQSTNNIGIEELYDEIESQKDTIKEKRKELFHTSGR